MERQIVRGVKSRLRILLEAVLHDRRQRRGKRRRSRAAAAPRGESRTSSPPSSRARTRAGRSASRSSTTPKLKMSLRASHALPAHLLRRHVADRAEHHAGLGAAHGRARRPSVPIGLHAAWRGRSRGSSRARRCVTKMFSGFRSRCTIPRACAAASPSRDLRRRSRARAAAAAVRARASPRSVSPSSSSVTMYGVPSCVPKSWIVTMFGWLSAAAARASRSKRAQPLRVVEQARAAAP